MTQRNNSNTTFYLKRLRFQYSKYNSVSDIVVASVNEYLENTPQVSIENDVGQWLLAILNKRKEMYTHIILASVMDREDNHGGYINLSNEMRQRMRTVDSSWQQQMKKDIQEFIDTNQTKFSISLDEMFENINQLMDQIRLKKMLSFGSKAISSLLPNNDDQKQSNTGSVCDKTKLSGVVNLSSLILTTKTTTVVVVNFHRSRMN